MIGAITNAGTIVFAEPVATTLAAPVSGGGSLKITGASAVSLSAASSFSGGIDIIGGKLALEALGAAGSGPIRFGAGGSALFIGAGDTPANTITGYVPGETIDLAGFSAGGATAILNSNDQLVVSDGLHIATLRLTKAAEAFGFGVAASSDGIAVTPVPFSLTVPDVTIAVGAGGQFSASAATGLLPGVGNPDGFPISVLPAQVAGTFGSLSLKGDGSYTYSAGAAGQQQAALSAFSPGGYATDTFGYVVHDAVNGVARSANLAVQIDRPATVTGIAAQQSGDDEHGSSPFQAAIVANPDNGAQTLQVSLALHASSQPAAGGSAIPLANLAGGSFTAASLAASGFTANPGTPGEFDLAGTGDQVTAALRALVFQPAAHLVKPSDFVISRFDLSIDDGNAAPVTTATTQLTTKAIDDGPAPPALKVSVMQRKSTTGSLMTGVTDPDYGAALVVSAMAVGASGAVPVPGVGLDLTGQYGTLHVDPDGTYAYSATRDGLVDGKVYTDAFSYTVSDEPNYGTQFATAALTINVVGSGIGDPTHSSVIIGGDAADTLMGGSAADTITGGAAGNTIFGGGGGDTLIAGTGPDVFALGSAADSQPAAPDTIKGFRTGIDKIGVSALPYSAWQIDLQPGSTQITVYQNPSIVQIGVQGFAGPGDIVTQSGGAFYVSGNASVVGRDFDGLFSPVAGPSQILITDSQPVPLTLATFAQDRFLFNPLANADGSPVIINVVDSAANLSGKALDKLQFLEEINAPVTSIIVAGNGPSEAGYVTASVAEYQSDYLAFPHMEFASGDTRVLDLVDTAANISANFFLLASGAKGIPGYQVPSIGQITVSDNQPVRDPYFTLFDTTAIGEMRNANGSSANVIISPLLQFQNNMALDGVISNLPVISGNSAPLDVVTFSVDGTPIPSIAHADAQGSWSLTASGLSDGHHTLVADEVNPIGNVGTASISFTVDSTAPSIALTSPGFRQVADPNVTVTGTIDPAFAGLAISILSANTTPVGTAHADAKGNWSTTVTLPAQGVYNLVAAVTDAAGNQIASSNNDLVNFLILGAVTKVSASGAGGEVVTGAAVTLSLAMNVGVTVSGGSPSLTLNDGGTAFYDAKASTSQTLVFDYTVGAGDKTSDLEITSVNLPAGVVVRTTLNASVDFSAGLHVPTALAVNATPAPRALTWSGAGGFNFGAAADWNDSDKYLESRFVAARDDRYRAVPDQRRHDHGVRHGGGTSVRRHGVVERRLRGEPDRDFHRRRRTGRHQRRGAHRRRQHQRSWHRGQHHRRGEPGGVGHRRWRGRGMAFSG